MSFHHSGQSVDEVFGDMPLYCPTKESCQSHSTSSSGSLDVARSSIDQMSRDSKRSSDGGPAASTDTSRVPGGNGHVAAAHTSVGGTSTDQMHMRSNDEEQRMCEGCAHAKDVGAANGGKRAVLGASIASIDSEIAVTSADRRQNAEADGQPSVWGARDVELISSDSVLLSEDGYTCTSSSDFDDYVHDPSSGEGEGWQPGDLAAGAEVGSSRQGKAEAPLSQLLHSVSGPATRWQTHTSEVVEEAAVGFLQEPASTVGNGASGEVMSNSSVVTSSTATCALSRWEEDGLEGAAEKVGGSSLGGTASLQRSQNGGVGHGNAPDPDGSDPTGG
jgi:hypothetical protein